MSIKKLVASAIVMGVIAISANATMVSYQFEGITSNISGDIAIGEAQFSLEVTNDGLTVDKVMFVFKNEGDQQVNITDIVFDDASPALLSFDSFKYAEGDVVSYKQATNVPVLPGANSAPISFVVDDAFIPRTPNPILKAIGVGEELGIIFNINDATFDDVIDGLNTIGVSDNRIRVGVHAQSYVSGGSESFMVVPHSTTQNVPEPTTLSLLGLSLLGIGFIRRKVK